jgi:uncharacterized protein YecT (DUF1311 family)
MIARITIAVSLLINAAHPGRAADCSAAETQADMTSCAAEDYKDADAELNTVYKQVADRLKAVPDSSKLLVAAQRAWIAFRDSECSFASSAVAGGSLQPMINATCMAGLTRARTEELKNYLNCPEGDTSCPVPPG